MSGSRYITPYAYAYDTSGLALPGALLYFYASGSSTIFADTYTDEDLTTLNPNPVPANDSGTFPNIFLDPSITYRVVLTHALVEGGAEIWTADPVSSTGQISVATNRTAMEQMSGTAGRLVFLLEPQRQGWFQCVTGAIPSDPLQGLYVPTATVGFYWSRVWDEITGQPEWFGAISGSSTGSIPAANHAAIQACITLCPITQLKLATYYVNDTVWLDTDYRTLAGALFGIEGPLPQGTSIVQTDNTKDVVRVGGTSPADRRRIQRISDIAGRWLIDPVPPTDTSDAGRLAAPKAFHYMHALVFESTRCIAVDALIGHAFYDTINSQVALSGCTRTKSLGANDFMWGLRPYGTAVPGLAGGNASLYLNDCNVTITDGSLQTSIDKATGLYATQDWADLYVDGLETSQVNFGIRMDGTGVTYVGGHGDVRLRKLVFDQCKGNGIEIKATNNYAKIQIDQFYIQVVSTGPSSNNGILCINGGGFITIANGQITGGAGNQSIGIWLEGFRAISVDDTVCIDSVAYPVNLVGCQGLQISPMIGDGLNGSGGTRAAISLSTATTQCIIKPNIRGGAGTWSEGINLIGTGNDKNSIDPTGVDVAAIAGSRKVVINGVNITAPGYYTPAGAGGSSGQGVYVTGITV